MIIGKQVRLRAIEREDLTKFVQWLNDPEVIRGLLLTVPLSFTQEQAWFDGLRSRPTEEHPLGIEIETSEGWSLIGNIGLNRIEWKERSAEVGIFIGDKRYWSQGFGRQTMVLMLRHAFNNLGLNRVFLRVHETNPRAIHSYEKAGFVHEARLRQAHFEEGRFIDVLLMSVLRAEWQDDQAV